MPGCTVQEHQCDNAVVNCPNCAAPMDLSVPRGYYWLWLDYGELKQIIDAPGADRGSRDPS